MVFLGKDGDGSGPVALADRPGCFQSCDSSAQHEILSVRVILIAGAGIARGHKVLRTDAADRAGFNGSVKNCAADQALDQLRSALGRLLLLFLEKDTSEIVSEIVGILELGGIGLKTDPETVQDIQTDLLQAFDDVRDAFSGPAVASERGSQSSLEDRGIHAESQVVDRLQGLAENGGRAEQISVRSCHIRSQAGLVVKDQVIAVNLRAGILNAPGDRFRELLGVAVRADIRHDHQLLCLRRRRLAPLTVPAENLVEMRIQDRAVAAADMFDLKVFDPLKGIVHIRICKRADDAVKIILGGVCIARLIRDGGSHDAFRRVVRAEGVAGEQRLDLRHIGIHGVRPVQVRKDHEFQGLVPQGEGHAVADCDAVEICVDDMLEELDRGSGGDDRNVRIHIEKLLDRAGVIRLRVIHDQIIDL